MDTLKAMQAFVAVARQQGFASSAHELGLSTSQVSRHVQHLEEQFGVRLFNRTTRNLSLTQAGKGLLGHCQRIVNDVEDLIQSTKHRQAEPGGRLRITMPVFLGELFARDTLSRYVADHPKVDVELLIVDRVVNLVEENFDLAIRAGELPDSTLISRKLFDLGLALVASPRYIEQHGKPARPSDLRKHNCLVDTVSPYGDRWPLTDGHSTRRIQVNGNMRVNSGNTARDFAIGGAGLTLLPGPMVIDDIRQHRLVTVLDEYLSYEGGIYVVYPQTRHLYITVQSFTDFLIKETRSMPHL